MLCGIVVFFVGQKVSFLWSDLHVVSRSCRGLVAATLSNPGVPKVYHETSQIFCLFLSLWPEPNWSISKRPTLVVMSKYCFCRSLAVIFSCIYRPAERIRYRSRFSIKEKLRRRLSCRSMRRGPISRKEMSERLSLTFSAKNAFGNSKLYGCDISLSLSIGLWMARSCACVSNFAFFSKSFKVFQRNYPTQFLWANRNFQKVSTDVHCAATCNWSHHKNLKPFRVGVHNNKQRLFSKTTCKVHMLANPGARRYWHLRQRDFHRVFSLVPANLVLKSYSFDIRIKSWPPTVAFGFAFQA